MESVPNLLQMELIDLQCNSELKTKFREAQGNADKTAQFLRELPPCFPELSKVFSRLMCLFGSTYVCEKLFSTMNFNKCKFRLSDAHLEAVLRVSTVNSIRHYHARLGLNMVLDKVGSTGPGREHVRKLFLQPGYIGELGGREVIPPGGQSE